ncbi:hypothetical protein L484_004195 [Morus notabilis]|uniref:Cell division control protein 24 OB domain-containing protein n=1 Tax=Morus notabilis TaxID=981085 RepID=W9RFZ7_9ROSA|nr:hypothetical protein L484_004195 [Morus notabilis]
MAVDQPQEDDPFLRFIDYARSMLSPEDENDDDEDFDLNGRIEADIKRPSWNWIASRILKTCTAYSSGVTAAILLSDLSQAWNEQHRDGAPRKRPECINQLKKKRGRAKLPNTVTIDSIYEKNFLSMNSVLEAVIVDAFVLPGTNIYMLTLGDFWSSNTIDLYLPRRYYELVDPRNGILKKGREILLTGCHLRTAAEGSGHPCLLPTEYLVILLDEDEDDDVMLIGAQFCSDSFSSISLDAVNQGVSYSLYARIEFIGSSEIDGKFGSLQKKQITLVDEDGVKLKFLLWGEQIQLANLFSIGSMLGLDRPYIASSLESGLEESDKICLEYGSATQLYLAPFIQHEEQVRLTLTQNWGQGSGLLSTLDLTPGPRVSQVSLPRDSQGSVDFRSYPFQTYVTDLHDKMTGISLSLRRISLGHTVYISGLACSMTRQNSLEALWLESDTGASFINLSCLPALLNSPCLHKLSKISNLSTQTSSTQIASIWLDMAHCHGTTRLTHVVCGHLVNQTPSGVMECSFCLHNCDTEVVRSLHLKITLADESGKIFAWSAGQTAIELLQISPDEFHELPEEEQIMFFSSLHKERFIVALVNCNMEVYGQSDGFVHENDSVSWEITRALKCE